MKRLIYPLAGIAIIICSAFTIKVSQDWKIADNYSIKFDGGDPSGSFGGLKGGISFDPSDLDNSKLNVSLDVASINTGNGMKNTHAKSPKWFDAEKYPTISFVSSSISKTSSGYDTKGTLTMHGIQKQIEIPLHSPIIPFREAFRSTGWITISIRMSPIMELPPSRWILLYR